MTTRRPLTAQIKPDTRNAIMDQLALAASEIERLKVDEMEMRHAAQLSCEMYLHERDLRWWQRLARWLP